MDIVDIVAKWRILNVHTASNVALNDRRADQYCQCCNPSHHQEGLRSLELQPQHSLRRDRPWSVVCGRCPRKSQSPENESFDKLCSALSGCGGCSINGEGADW